MSVPNYYSDNHASILHLLYIYKKLSCQLFKETNAPCSYTHKHMYIVITITQSYQIIVVSGISTIISYVTWHERIGLWVQNLIFVLQSLITFCLKMVYQ